MIDTKNNAVHQKFQNIINNDRKNKVFERLKRRIFRSLDDIKKSKD